MAVGKGRPIKKIEDKKQAADRQSLLLKLAGFREMGIVFFLVALVTVISLRSPIFFTLDNIYDIGLDVAILAIVAVGQMMVIMTRGIDISVGTGIGLSGMVVALILQSNQGISPVVAILIGLAVGAVMGSLNGILIVKGKIPPIMATLGTMSIFRGLTFIINYWINGGKWIGADKLSDAFKNFARGAALLIPNLILITVIVYAIFYYFLNHTTTGREMYAVGSNPDSAKVIGINTDKIIFLTYLITGMLVGMGGVLWVSRYSSAQTDSAVGFEFTVITAVVLGGVAISGGTGTIFGVLLGSVLIGVINNSLNLIRISPFWKLAINGLIILLAVIVDKLVSEKTNEILLERRKL